MMLDSSDRVRLFGDADALAAPAVEREDLAEGGFILRHPEPLGAHARCVGEWLDRWAAATPSAIFLAERDAHGNWRCLDYAQVRTQVGLIAQGLLDHKLPDGPIVVLSDNSVDHALLSLAAMHVGRVICTISSAYCRLSKTYEKIHGILDQLEPSLVYASDASAYGAAMAGWRGSALRVLGRGAQEVPDAVAFSELLAAAETLAVGEAFRAIRPDDEAKYLLTSGSTGSPKVVINTHRMLCANQQQISQVWPFLMRHKLVLLDWLPWSHTFGANHNFNMVLANGGSLYIDDGRPAPGFIEKTLRNLRDVRPNFYFNVPRGFDMLLPYLEQDAVAARDVCERLEGIFYAGAALPQSLWTRLEAVAGAVRVRPLWFTSAWGATETAPAVTTVHWRIPQAGCIGLPLPGAELKFVPNGEKLELRVRGPNVFRAYRRAPDTTAKAFDNDDFYVIGDAGTLVDPSDATKGVAFDGRVAEDFKLTSGTWVSVGTLRLQAVSALAPYVSDVVIAGHDRADVGLLVFPTPQGAAMPPGDLASHISRCLRTWKSSGAGSSQVPARAILMTEPPSADAGEITDKGYINQRAVLTRRARDVAALFETTDGACVVLV